MFTWKAFQKLKCWYKWSRICSMPSECIQSIWTCSKKTINIPYQSIGVLTSVIQLNLYGKTNKTFIKHSTEAIQFSFGQHNIKLKFSINPYIHQHNLTCRDSAIYTVERMYTSIIFHTYVQPDILVRFYTYSYIPKLNHMSWVKVFE